MRSKRSGFTLIELLVVIAIIGIIASVILASLTNARAKARDAYRISAVRQIMYALELYYNQYGVYPTSGSCGSTIPNSGWCNSVESMQNGHWIRNGTTDLSSFISKDPTDPRQGATPNWTPLNGGTMFYYANGYGGPGKWYMIVFGLEQYPNLFEKQSGVKACDGTVFNYGTGSNGLVTIGMSNC